MPDFLAARALSTSPGMSASQLREAAHLEEGPPVIAVVIPVYKQPGYLQDAVLSVMKQSMLPNIRIVIVNDGCPFAGTDELGQLFRSTYPGKVYYLRKPNGGLSSARNYGIRFALDTWPSIQAVLPLDADNVLSPHTVERLWQSLMQSPDGADWAYQDLTIFGTEDTAWRTRIPFSTYRLLHENFCDAGALVHRRVFDAGVWYDETMKGGYEDWEMFIRASLNGFRGVHAPETSFLYRLHGHSMLTDAQQQHRDIYEFIVQKHAEHFQPHRLAEREHDELPRFALAELDTDRVKWTTNPYDADHSTMSIEAYLDILAAWEAGSRPKSVYTPPITLIGTGDVIEQFRRLRVLPGLLIALQSLTARYDCAYLNYQQADSPYVIKLRRAEEPDGAGLFAFPTRRLIEVGKQRGNRLQKLIRSQENFTRAGLTLQVGLSHIIHAGGLADDRRAPQQPGGARPGLFDAVGEVLNGLSTRLDATPPTAERQDGYTAHERFVGANAYFAANQQLDKGAATFPYFVRTGNGDKRGTGIWFTVPWIRLGGVDQIVLNLARQFAELSPARGVHLAITNVNEVEADPRALDVFDTVTFLAGSEEESKEQELFNVLGGADIIFNAHSRATYDALPHLRSAISAPIVSLLQVIDPDHFGVPRGYPVLASRRYEPLIDHFVVPSRRLKRTCVNLGVPEEKVLVVPNAPVVRPPSLESALAMARGKAQRPFSATRPLRILFVGRFDDQKGFDRLGPILEQLREHDVPFELKIIGKAVLSRIDPARDLPEATILPSAQDPTMLAQYYADTDVLLLPSRWEGVPLSMLEAMAFGNIIVATNVGAIDEVLEDGVNGFLIDPHQPESEIVRMASQTIADVALREAQCRGIREEAARTAMSFTWRDSAMGLMPLIEKTGLDRTI